MTQPSGFAPTAPMVLWNDAQYSEAKLRSRRSLMVGLMVASVLLIVLSLGLLALAARWGTPLQGAVFVLVVIAQLINVVNMTIQIRAINGQLRQLPSLLAVSPLGFTINDQTLAWSTFSAARVRGLGKAGQTVTLGLRGTPTRLLTLDQKLCDQQGRLVPTSVLIDQLRQYLPVKG